MLYQIGLAAYSPLFCNPYDLCTVFPWGKVIVWGPLFAFIGATVAIAAGTSTRAGIIGVFSFILPALAVLTIPLVYCIGKAL